MRIVAGDYKGRKLEAPMGERVRPTSEKVKEAVFSSIMHHLNDAVCVDLFAGTGNLGLEALSRGARKCYFSDNARDSLKLVESNIARCKAEKYSKVLRGDCLDNLSRICEKIDIFFLDPPYNEGLYDKCLQKISDLGLLNKNGIIICEHSKNLELPDEMSGFRKVKEKNYGTIVISIFC